MQTVIDNILLNYEVAGINNKDTILIIHGWQNSLKNWENIANRLSLSHKIISIDLPGMGNSSISKEKAFDTYDYADFVNKFINKLNLKNLILIGHSFGGKLSTIIASENSEVKKLVLVDPSGIYNPDIITSTKLYISKIIRLVLPKKISRKLSSYLGSDDYNSAGKLLPSFKKIVTQDISENAKKIKVKTLIVWGENDKEVPLTSAKILKNLIVNSSLRVVWKSGHHPHIEKQDKFLEIIEEFI